MKIGPSTSLLQLFLYQNIILLSSFILVLSSWWSSTVGRWMGGQSEADTEQKAEVLSAALGVTALLFAVHDPWAPCVVTLDVTPSVRFSFFPFWER